MQLYRNESSHPLTNAQRNLCGRTHYVDSDTLRFHKSRVLSSRTTDNGLLFAIITSDALDMNNSRRGCRFVIFDIFGTVLARTDLEGAFRTSTQAEKAMWKALNAIDAKAVTLAAIERQAKRHADEMADLASKVSKLEA
jgi:hypothetical protein